MYESRKKNARKYASALVVAMIFGVSCSSKDHDYNGDGKVRIACVGDSNTETLEWHTGSRSWCDLLADAVTDRGWVVTNYGVPATGVVKEGTPHLRLVMAENPDVVIIAFGTVDLATHSVEKTLSGYRVLMKRLDERGLYGIVALTPFAIVAETSSVISLPTTIGMPIVHPAFNESVEKLNSALKREFASHQLLDFHQASVDHEGNVDETLFIDRIHLNAAGQFARAALAFEFLTGEKLSPVYSENREKTGRPKGSIL